MARTITKRGSIAGGEAPWRSACAWLLLVAMFVLLASCAPEANDQVRTPGAGGEVAGFWLGLWHGFVAPFTFIVSLFSDSVGVYEIHNNGGWYNLGFVFGASLIFGGGGHGSARGRRR